MISCPKCQRPIEGEEVYICCANLELRWRCGACGKVSEGFAFPYGMCPHCNGKLEILERGPINDTKGLAAIRAAFEIELGGHAFYRRAANESKAIPASALRLRYLMPDSTLPLVRAR